MLVYFGGPIEFQIIILQNGDTALHIAAAMGRRKLTRVLLESGCDQEIKNKVIQLFIKKVLNPLKKAFVLRYISKNFRGITVQSTTLPRTLMVNLAAMSHL